MHPVLQRILAVPLNFLFPGLGLVVLGRPRLGLLTGPILLALATLPFGLLAVTQLPFEPFVSTLPRAYPAAVLLGLGLVLFLPLRPFPFGKMQWLPAVAATACFASPLIPISVRLLVFEAFEISSDAMAPVMSAGDVAYSLKIGPRASIRHGDLVVFDDPADDGRRLLRRAVALGGDVVEIRDGSILVNGGPIAQVESTLSLPAISVPEGHFFALSDDLVRGRDSRQFGSVSIESLVGVIRAIRYGKRPDKPAGSFAEL